MIAIKKYLLFVPLFSCCSCVHHRNKADHIRSVKLKDNLYVESYRGGVVGSLTSEYLTDSTNFRIYLGEFDEEQGYIYCHVKGDSIKVEKLMHGVAKGLKFDELAVVDSATYSMKELKRQHYFE